jgi:hypothetical protein
MPRDFFSMSSRPLVAPSNFNAAFSLSIVLMVFATPDSNLLFSKFIATTRLSTLGIYTVTSLQTSFAICSNIG